MAGGSEVFEHYGSGGVSTKVHIRMNEIAPQRASAPGPSYVQPEQYSHYEKPEMGTEHQVVQHDRPQY